MRYPTKELLPFLRLWSTQAFSALGSAMTSFALIIWSYQQAGSALSTALLTLCSYTPYVIMSIFAGALSDRWDKKRTMLWCDAFAALCTLAVWGLLRAGILKIGYIYALNALNGLMNTLQQPASEVAVTLLTPKGNYQRVSGLKAFSNSLVTVLTPALASALMMFAGLEGVIFFDLITCAVALVVLGCGVRLPKPSGKESRGEPLAASARQGLCYLVKNRGILDLILFLAAINWVASMYNAALPAMVLSRPNGGEGALGWVNTLTGLASLAGSLLVSFAPAPRSRVRVIMNALLFSMSTENLLLCLGRRPIVWGLGAVLGWLCIPAMNTNLDALLRSRIPVEMQGRVYAARNTLQFFTIPLGYLMGGALVDEVMEPLMAALPQTHWLLRCLGRGKGSGAALLFGVLALLGVAVCLIFRRDKRIWQLEK